MTLTLPFLHLNLRWNPFGEVPQEEVADLAVLDVPLLFPGDVLQIRGECGRGKTTTLLALKQKYPNALYEYLEQGQKTLITNLSALPKIFLLDEAQRLKHSLLCKLFSCAKTLVLATHEDLSPYTDRPVRSIEKKGLSLKQLAKILKKRVEWARRSDGPIPRFSDQEICTLLDRYDDDLRAIEEHLYRVFQTMENIDDVIL